MIENRQNNKNNNLVRKKIWKQKKRTESDFINVK